MRKLDPHQITAKRFIANHNGVCGLFMAPGTGKTIVDIRTAPTPRLIICRRDDFLTWEQELLAEGVLRRKIRWITSSKNPLPPFLPGRHYITTYDLVKNKKIQDWIKSMPFLQVTWDEFHYCKRWKSARTKANYKATRHIPRRVGLTGTAITNHVRDVWSLGYLLDNGRTFGNKEWWFLKKTHLRAGKAWYPKKGVKDTIKEQLKKLAFYVHEDDVLKLPPCRPSVKGVPMTGMQRRQYERVLTEWETELADGTHIEFDQVIVQMAKLRQIASGFIYDEHKNAHWFRNNKMPFLFKMLTDPDYFEEKEKVVVWASHNAEIERIAEEAEDRNIKYVTFYGRNRRAKRAARISFRDEPKVRLFIGQVDSGVGMNELIVADTAFWYSNSLKVVSKEQSRRRNRRRGSEIHRRIHHITICTEGTLDFRLAKSISAAMNLAHEILSACRAGESPRKFLT
jgi:SNF2 family DNA or RNA helicase